MNSQLSIHSPLVTGSIMATSYASSSQQVNCALCNALVKPSYLTRHMNAFCFARPKPGQRLAPGACPHCLKAITVAKMERHLLHECPRLTIQCPFCTHRFRDIIQHRWKKHHDKRNSEQFKRLKNVPDPYQSVSGEPRAPKFSDLAPGPPDRRESCPICHTHMDEFKLRKHVSVHCKVKCPCCYGKFKKNGIQNHLINCCLPKLSSPTGSVECLICSKRGSLHFISQHLSENHLTLFCPICASSMGVNRVLDHMRKCSAKQSPAPHLETPLLPGVFQDFLELGDNGEVYSGSGLSSEDSSDDEPIKVRPRRRNRSSKSKRAHAPLIDLTDPNYILLPVSQGKKGANGNPQGDYAPSVSWNHKISCPICNDDCPLRMVGRHITETHISHSCPVCNESIGHNSFKPHLEECLGRYGAKGEEGSSYFPCPYCSISKPSVGQMSKHISRTHRELDCPFCQESYAARSYAKHVNNCARVSVLSAQLIQENPSLDTATVKLALESSEGATDSESGSDGYVPARSDPPRMDKSSLEEGESIVSCVFCNFQCMEVPLEDHIAECTELPSGMRLVSMPNLLGLRIN